MTRFIAALLVLMLAACNPPTAPVAFTVAPDRTKTFFYAAYNNPDDQPFFDKEFRLHVDGSYVEDIDADEYIEQHLSAGNHVFDVEEIAWAGNTLGHTTLTVHIDVAKTYYIAEEIGADGKAVLTTVSQPRGEQEVAARKRKCPCQFLISHILP